MELTEQYLQGFNHAYLLAEHTPELLEKLLTVETKTEYLQGMLDGKNTFEQEQVKSKTQNRIEELNQLNRIKNKEQSRER